MPRSAKTTSLIRRFIASLPDGQMFSTRECLNFGQRSAVDQALYRMVQQGYLVRLAQGVFTKARQDGKVPPLHEVAVFKATIFGRRVVQMSVAAQDVDSIVLGTDGASTSFQVGNQRVVLKQVSPRKCLVENNEQTRAISALWLQGRHNVTPDMIAEILHDVGREERHSIKLSCSVMPSWLSDFLVWRNAQSATRLPTPAQHRELINS